MATVTATELSLDNSLEQFKEQFNTLRSDLVSVTYSSLIEDAGGTIVFEGSTVDDFETTLAVVDPTADRTVSLPDATTTLVGKDTTDTLTNKTVNLSSNTLTGTTAQFNVALSDGSFATLAGTETLTNKTLTTPVISSISNSGTLTLPTSTDTLVGRATTDTLTNKTLTSPVISSISNSGTLTLPTSTDTLVGRATTDTLTNKTLTSPVISTISNTGTLTLPTSTGTLALTSDNVASATLASTVTVSDSTANTNFPIVFHNESNGLLDDTGALRYNPSTGTLLAPNLVVAGTTTQVNTVTMNAQNAVVFEGATANDFETTLTITDPTADRTITMPDATGTMALTSDITLSTLSVTASAAELNYNDITTLGTVQASKTVTADASGDVLFVDNDKLKFGTTVDGNIYSDGTNFTFSSTTAETHYANYFQWSNGGASETLMTATQNGSVDLYYDNAKKFETTAAGVTITGTVTVTNPGNSLLIKNSAGTTLKTINGV